MSSIEVNKLRINERIKSREVLLIDEDGTKIGLVPIEKALELAREREVDLVEIAPTSKPPVCKVMDFGRFKYQTTKKAHEAKKHQKVIQIKEVTFRPKIDEHDYEFKRNNANRFLAEGNKVKAVIIFRGREIIHAIQGETILARLAKDVQEVGAPEAPSKREGHRMTLILAPKKKG